MKITNHISLSYLLFNIFTLIYQCKWYGDFKFLVKISSAVWKEKRLWYVTCYDEGWRSFAHVGFSRLGQSFFHAKCRWLSLGWVLTCFHTWDDNSFWVIFDTCLSKNNYSRLGSCIMILHPANSPKGNGKPLLNLRHVIDKLIVFVQQSELWNILPVCISKPNTRFVITIAASCRF